MTEKSFYFRPYVIFGVIVSLLGTNFPTADAFASSPLTRALAINVMPLNTQAIVARLVVSPRQESESDAVRRKAGLARAMVSGQSRADHIAFHNESNLKPVLNRLAKVLGKLGAPVPVIHTGTEVWHDFQSVFLRQDFKDSGLFFAEADGNGHVATLFAPDFLDLLRGNDPGLLDIRMEYDGIVVIVHEGFKGDHAGRSGIVMARSEAMARHELRELRALTLWAYRHNILTERQISNGELGTVLQEWLNVPGEVGRKRRSDYYGRSFLGIQITKGVRDRHHQEGLVAEGSNGSAHLDEPDRHFYEGVRFQFSKHPTGRHLRDAGTMLGRADSIIASGQGSVPEQEPRGIAPTKWATNEYQLDAFIDRAGSFVDASLVRTNPLQRLFQIMKEGSLRNSEIAGKTGWAVRGIPERKNRLLQVLRIRYRIDSEVDITQLPRLSDDENLTSLPLTPRAEHGLWELYASGKIQTVGDLTQRNRVDLMKEGVSEAAIADLQVALALHGRHLAEPQEPVTRFRWAFNFLPMGFLSNGAMSKPAGVVSSVVSHISATTAALMLLMLASGVVVPHATKWIQRVLTTSPGSRAPPSEDHDSPSKDPAAVAERLPLRDGLQLKSLDVIRKDYIQRLFPKEPTLTFAKPLRDSLARSMSGLVLIPTLFLFGQKVGQKPAILDLIAHEPQTLRAIAEATNPGHAEENMGMKSALLRMLALQGWVQMEGKDESATFVLTAQGRSARKIAKLPVLWQAALAFDEMSDYHRAMRTVSLHTENRMWTRETTLLKNLELLLEKSRGQLTPPWNSHVPPRWFEDISEDPVDVQVQEHVRSYLDGIVLASISIALGMPLFGSDGHMADSSFIEKFSPSPDGLSLSIEQVKGSSHEAFLRAALGFIGTVKPFGASLGRWEDQGQRFVLTAEGEAFLKKAPAFGVPGSYIRSYEAKALQKMVFDPVDPDPLGIAHHRHVDQVMNSWGSHNTHEVLLPMILEAVLPLVEKGVPGLVELACGDANIVATISSMSLGWRRVLDRYDAELNRDGKPLLPARSKSPWVVMGVDYATVLRGRIRDTFERLAKFWPRVITETVVGPESADISRPKVIAQVIDNALLGLGVNRAWRFWRREVHATDFAYLVMFGVEERDFQVKTLASAHEILQRSIHRVLGWSEGQEALLKILIEMGALPKDASTLPSEAELFDLIRAQFTISHNDGGRLVPAEVSGADLIQYIDRLGELAPQGLIIFDVLTPAIDKHFTRTQDTTAVAYWGSHLLREKIYTDAQRRLAYLLAGMRVETNITKGNPPLVGMVRLSRMAHEPSSQGRRNKLKIAA